MGYSVRAFARKDEERQWMQETKKRLQRVEGKGGGRRKNMTAVSIIAALSTGKEEGVRCEQVERKGVGGSNPLTKSTAEFLQAEQEADSGAVVSKRVIFDVQHSERYANCHEDDEDEKHDKTKEEELRLQQSIDRLTNLLQGRRFLTQN